MLDQLTFILALFVLITHFIFKFKGLSLSDLPISKMFATDHIRSVHQWGLFFAAGYILFSLPSLFS